MKMPVPLRYLSPVLLLLLLSPKPTSAGSWIVGVGPGVTSNYTYQTYEHSSSQVLFVDRGFGNSFIATIGIERKLGEHVSLCSSVDNFRNGGSDQISVNMTAVSIGLRRPFGPAGPYVEFLPSAYVGHWTDTAFNYAITSVQPGFQVGAGVRGPCFGNIGFEMGADYRYSADWPSVRQHFDSSDYIGLRQWVAGMKLTFAL